MVFEPEPPPPPPTGEFATAFVRPQPTVAQRVVAIAEVLLCSDYPTQLGIGAALTAMGVRAQAPGGGLEVTYVVALSLVDTALLVALIAFFLAAHGERLRDLLFGDRPIGPELIAGLPLAIASLALAIAILVPIQQFAPRLHTVEHNPLEELIHTPADAALLGVVVVIAGGVREEIQRAFLLRRFGQSLGGERVGLVITSAAFGAGHLLQGADAAIATGILGAFWGVVYLRRGSAVAPIVSHAGFNLLQLAQVLAFKR